MGEVLGKHYYSHSKLDTLFMEHGAPGDPPDGNCVDKCRYWLKRASDLQGPESLKVLGGVLSIFMDVDDPFVLEEQEQNRQRIRDVMGKYGLTYQAGGLVTSAGVTITSRALDQILKSRDLAALEVEHQRALASVSSDPPAALTAACAILEALFKVYIQDEGIPLPKEQTLKPLWSAVQKHLGFDPASVEDDDLRRILGGLSSVVDGIGALRTHAGSAHGRGRMRYNVQARHARLAVNASYTLTTFVLETWQARKDQKLTG